MALVQIALFNLGPNLVGPKIKTRERPAQLFHKPLIK
jgi:hypothetical protein